MTGYTVMLVCPRDTAAKRSYTVLETAAQVAPVLSELAACCLKCNTLRAVGLVQIPSILGYQFEVEIRTSERGRYLGTQG